MREDVDVGRAAGVVARDDGLELDHTVDVGLLEAAEEGLVEVGGVVGVAVAGGYDAGVDACGVAVPGVDVNGRDGLAGRGVDELDVEVEGNTGLVLRHVCANQLAVDVVWALSDLWLENAGGIIGEEKGLVVANGDIQGGRMRGVVLGKVAANDVALGADLVGHLLATGNGSVKVSTAAQVVGAAADRLGVASLDPLGSLSSLNLHVVAWVGESAIDGNETKGQEGEDRGHSSECRTAVKE